MTGSKICEHLLFLLNHKWQHRTAYLYMERVFEVKIRQLKESCGDGVMDVKNLDGRQFEENRTQWQ